MFSSSGISSLTSPLRKGLCFVKKHLQCIPQDSIREVEPGGGTFITREWLVKLWRLDKSPKSTIQAVGKER